MTDPRAQRPAVDRRPLLERPELKPEERNRIGRAAAALLGWFLFATALLGFLALWHLVRRGRMIRANQPPPRPVSLPEIERNPPVAGSP
jgi:hypothetical protein